MRTLSLVLITVLAIGHAFAQSVSPIAPGSGIERAVTTDGGSMPQQIKVVGGKRGTTVIPITLDDQDRLRVDATVSEVATSTDGGAAPSDGKMVGGLDSGGNLQFVSVDTNGDLQVDVLSLPGSFAEDSAHSSGDNGLQVFGVRNDAGISLADDGDYHPLTLDSTGRLRVDAAITESATAADGASAPSVSKVVAGVDGGGDTQTLSVDSNGRVNVNVVDSLPAGTNNIGDVDVDSLPGTVETDIGTIAGAVSGTEMQVDVVGPLPAGTNNIGDVDVASQPARSHTTDSIRLGDGTNLTDVTASGELEVSDATAQASLSSIDGKFGSLGQKAMAGSAPVVIASDQSAIPVSSTDLDIRDLTQASDSVAIGDGTDTIAISASGEASVQVTQALPAGTNNIGDVDVLTEPATAAVAATAPAEIKVSGGLRGSTVVAFQFDASNNLKVSSSPSLNTSGSQTTDTVSTVETITAPANSVGFILQAADTNTANLRYKIGGTATTTDGLQLQPGRDTGYVPVSSNISIVAESGTQEYQVQWILSN